MRIERYSDRHSSEIIIPPRHMNQVEDSLQGVQFIYPWIEHEIIALLQKLDWEQRERNVKEVYGVYTLVQKEVKHFLHNS